MTDKGREELRHIPVEKRDSFFLAQGQCFFNFSSQENHRRAIECYLEALRLAIRYKHQAILVQCYAQIGAVYEAQNNLAQAIRYYKMNYSGVLRSRPFNAAGLLRSTYHIAATYVKAGDTQNAGHYTLRMGQMLNWVNDSAQKNEYRLLIAHTFAHIGRAQAFNDYFNQIPATAVFKDGQLAYGRLYAEAKSKQAFYQGRKDSIIPPLVSELARTKDSVPLLELLQSAYVLQGDYKKAYESQQMLSTANLGSMNRNIYGDINYKLLMADNLLTQEQNAQLQLNEEGLHLKSFVLYSLSLILTLGFAITFYFFRRYRKRSRHIVKQNRLIQKHNDSNTLLLKEIHHRVKNNLQIISSMVEIQLNKPEIDLYFSMREIQTKMRTIAIAHQMMYEEREMEDVDLQLYFEKMVTMTLEVLVVSATPVQQKIEMNGIKMDLEKLVTLALAVNEMLINSVKHVLPCDHDCYIKMECKQEWEQLQFSYSDSGPGRSDQSTEIISGTGMRLIGKLAKQIGAHITVEKDSSGRIQYLLIFN